MAVDDRAGQATTVSATLPFSVTRAERRRRWAPTRSPALRTGDAAFAVDDAGRIVAWNGAARQLFGHGQEVRGQPCYDVLGCLDRRGRALCPQTCPLLQASLRGRPPPATTIFLSHRSRQTIEVLANVIVLGARVGAGALIVVRPSPAWVVQGSPPTLHPAGHEPALAEAGRAETAIDLAQMLDRLLLALGADAAEIFLTAPAGRYLVLTAHRGQAPRAFCQIARFEPGQGFPGLVAATGEAILTRDLLHDERYLRTAVKRQGFRSYVCVPIWGINGLLGTLDVASRSGDDRLILQRAFLEDVARELGCALELRRLRAADLVARQPLDPAADARAVLSQAVESCLRTLTSIAGVDGAALLLLDPHTQRLELARAWNLSPEVQRLLARPRSAAHCPAIGERTTVLPPDHRHMLSPCCRALARRLPATLCLPLQVHGQPLGAVLLACHHREPLPAQRLSVLHAALDRAALLIHNARAAAEQTHAERARMVQRTGPTTGAPSHTHAPTPAPPFLDLRCLGPFAVLRDGRLVPPEQFARRRSLTLLKILLTRYGKPVHREELMELLWPEADPRAARTLLNVVVHYLRRGLEPDAPADGRSSFIHTSGDAYWFNIEAPHRLDSQEFLALARRASDEEQAGRPGEAIALYRRAIAIYQGDFLEDEPYSDWCVLEREYLRKTFLTALRHAARLHARQGEVDAAVAYYRRALHADATLEDVHRALMELLWQAGRRDEALRQYHECRAVLERELGISPMPETESLRQRILARC